MKRRIIVAIGGGRISKGTLLPIDREIVKLSGKKHPKLLFLPTASSDSDTYWKAIQKYFGQKLRCRTDVLFLLKTKIAREEIARKILRSDIVYVGGGNTLMMMRRWRRLGVDDILRKAYRKGIVLCGISAGSICWFESGHSDSLSFSNPKKWNYIAVRGIGLLKGIHCPHYGSETRKKKRRVDFKRMIGQRGGFGIALDDLCSLICVDASFRILSSRKRAHAYMVYRANGKVTEKRIEESTEMSPLSELFSRN